MLVYLLLGELWGQQMVARMDLLKVVRMVDMMVYYLVEMMVVHLVD
jgi:hypothetical protein